MSHHRRRLIIDLDDDCDDNDNDNDFVKSVKREKDELKANNNITTLVKSPSTVTEAASASVSTVSQLRQPVNLLRKNIESMFISESGDKPLIRLGGDSGYKHIGLSLGICWNKMPKFSPVWKPDELTMKGRKESSSDTTAAAATTRNKTFNGAPAHILAVVYANLIPNDRWNDVPLVYIHQSPLMSNLMDSVQCKLLCKKLNDLFIYITSDRDINLLEGGDDDDEDKQVLTNEYGLLVDKLLDSSLVPSMKSIKEYRSKPDSAYNLSRQLIKFMLHQSMRWLWFIPADMRMENQLDQIESFTGGGGNSNHYRRKKKKNNNIDEELGFGGDNDVEVGDGDHNDDDDDDDKQRELEFMGVMQELTGVYSNGKKEESSHPKTPIIWLLSHMMNNILMTMDAVLFGFGALRECRLTAKKYGLGDPNLLRITQALNSRVSNPYELRKRMSKDSALITLSALGQHDMVHFLLNFKETTGIKEVDMCDAITIVLESFESETRKTKLNKKDKEKYLEHQQKKDRRILGPDDNKVTVNVVISRGERELSGDDRIVLRSLMNKRKDLLLKSAFYVNLMKSTIQAREGGGEEEDDDDDVEFDEIPTKEKKKRTSSKKAIMMKSTDRDGLGMGGVRMLTSLGAVTPTTSTTTKKPNKVSRSNASVSRKKSTSVAPTSSTAKIPPKRSSTNNSAGKNKPKEIIINKNNIPPPDSLSSTGTLIDLTQFNNDCIRLCLEEGDRETEASSATTTTEMYSRLNANGTTSWNTHTQSSSSSSQPNRVFVFNSSGCVSAADLIIGKAAVGSKVSSLDIKLNEDKNVKKRKRSTSKSNNTEEAMEVDKGDGGGDEEDDFIPKNKRIKPNETKTTTTASRKKASLSDLARKFKESSNKKKKVDSKNQKNKEDADVSDFFACSINTGRPIPNVIDRQVGDVSDDEGEEFSDQEDGSDNNYNYKNNSSNSYSLSSSSSYSSSSSGHQSSSRKYNGSSSSNKSSVGSLGSSNNSNYFGGSSSSGRSGITGSTASNSTSKAIHDPFGD